jgi:hypothetical protein
MSPKQVTLPVGKLDLNIFGKGHQTVSVFSLQSRDVDAVMKELFDNGGLAKSLDAIITTLKYNGTTLTWDTGTTRDEIVKAVNALMEDCPSYTADAIYEAARTLHLIQDPVGLAGQIANLYSNGVFSVTQSENTSKVKLGHGYLAIRKMRGWPWGDSN